MNFANDRGRNRKGTNLKESKSSDNNMFHGNLKRNKLIPNRVRNPPSPNVKVLTSKSHSYKCLTNTKKKRQIVILLLNYSTQTKRGRSAAFMPPNKKHFIMYKNTTKVL